MDMQHLTGGSLRAAGYDERARKLVIELTSGTYEYLGVPSEVWRRFSPRLWPYRAIRPLRCPRRGSIRALGRPCGARQASPRGPARILAREIYCTVSLRPATAGFFASVSASTPFSYFASLAASLSSVGNVKLR